MSETNEEIKLTPEDKALKTKTSIEIQKPDCNQCECCASQLGKGFVMNGAKRIICDQCLGFFTRWLLEMDTI